MEIDKIQKLNQLAQDLKKYKIVGSPDDAISEAEKVYGQGNNFVTKHNTGNEGVNMDEIQDMKREIRNLGFAIKKNEEQMQKIIEKMNEMIAEINSIKAAPRPQAGEGDAGENDPKKGTKDLNKPIDRNQIAPKDVSIEKYFYFGTK